MKELSGHLGLEIPLKMKELRLEWTPYLHSFGIFRGVLWPQGLESDVPVNEPEGQIETDLSSCVSDTGH